MRRVISAESDQCGECKVETSSTDKALQCDMCGHWFNFNCSKVSGKIYEMLCKNEDGGMSWFCIHCQISIPGAKKLLKRLTVLESTQREILEMKTGV